MRIVVPTNTGPESATPRYSGAGDQAQPRPGRARPARRTGPGNPPRSRLTPDRGVEHVVDDQAAATRLGWRPRWVPGHGVGTAAVRERGDHLPVGISRHGDTMAIDRDRQCGARPCPRRQPGGGHPDDGGGRDPTGADSNAGAQPLRGQRTPVAGDTAISAEGRANGRLRARSNVRVPGARSGSLPMRCGRRQLR